MKIETFDMTDLYAAKAVQMFADNDFESGKFHLISKESIAEDGMTLEGFLKRHSKIVIPNKDIAEYENFAMKFDKNWIVYVFYRSREILGMIAFSEWD